MYSPIEILLNMGHWQLCGYGCLPEVIFCEGTLWMKGQNYLTSGFLIEIRIKVMQHDDMKLHDIQLKLD